MDLNSSDVVAMNSMGLLKKYGLRGGEAGSASGGTLKDPPHVEINGPGGASDAGSTPISNASSPSASPAPKTAQSTPSSMGGGQTAKEPPPIASSNGSATKPATPRRPGVPSVKTGVPDPTYPFDVSNPIDVADHVSVFFNSSDPKHSGTLASV